MPWGLESERDDQCGGNADEYIEDQAGDREHRKPLTRGLESGGEEAHDEDDATDEGQDDGHGLFSPM